jgi:hypothetical protein
MACGATFLTRIGGAFAVVRIVRAPLFVSIFASIALFVPDQTREVYRILAQPWRTHGCIQLWFAAAAIVVATVIPPAAARELLLRYAQDPRLRTGAAGFLAQWLPVLCGALVAIGLAIGFSIAAGEMDFDLPRGVTESNPDFIRLRADAMGVARSLQWAAAFSGVLAVALLIGSAVAFRAGRDARDSSPFWFSGRFDLVLVSFIILASIAISFAPVAIGELMGSLSILLTFVVTLSAALSSLTARFDRYGVPVISGCFLFAVAFSAFGWNDNHAVEFDEREPTRLLYPREALNAWLDTRKDKDFYGADPYPVFFVTAAGGGMYAANHAATVLARMQDRCPNFAQHVFSISGVSGGSLGAAVFTGLAEHFAPNLPHQPCKLGPLTTGPLEKRVQNFFLDADLLAPVVASSLFPDFLQRFLPFRIDAFDRARALEAGFARAWPRAAPEKADQNPFRRPFLAHRKPDNPGPALILNATDVEQGYRVAITPLEIVSLGEIDNVAPMTKIVYLHNELRKADRKFNQDLTLGAAVGLSARFPWILPAGKVSLPQRELGPARDMRIVDGGYIENSGADATLDLIRSLYSSYHGHGNHKIAVHIITISSLQLIERTSWQGIGEILSPLRAMLSTRDSRGTVSIYHASTFADDCAGHPTCNQASGPFTIFPLNLLDFPVPLGWQLSPISVELIGLHSGNVDQASRVLEGSVIDPDTERRISGYVGQGNGSSCTLLRVLHGPGLSDSCVPQ